MTRLDLLLRLLLCLSTAFVIVTTYRLGEVLGG